MPTDLTVPLADADIEHLRVIQKREHVGQREAVRFAVRFTRLALDHAAMNPDDRSLVEYFIGLDPLV